MNLMWWKKTTPTLSRVLAETAIYAIGIENTKSTLTVSGVDTVYSVINKDTAVVEGRAANLPDAITYMNGLQNALDMHMKAGEGK